MALTGRAAIAALIGTLAALAFRDVAALIIVDGVIAAGIAADCALAAGVRQLQVARAGDARIMLGQRGTVTLTVANPGRRPLRAVVRDAWPPSAGARPGRVRVQVPAGGQVTIATTLDPERRGDRRAGLVTVRSLGPLGLAARQGNRSAPWTVRVLPPFLSRRHLPEKLAQLRQLDGQHRSMVRGQGTEFDSLREYVVGDDVRSIDWRSSARRTDVMVRTWRPERDRRIIVVLDTGRTSAGRVAVSTRGATPRTPWTPRGATPRTPQQPPAAVSRVPRLDAEMDAALLLAALASRAGDRVDLLAVDRQVRARVIGSGRGELLAALTSAMAVLDAELTEPDYGVMASAVLSIARQRCLVVLLTDLNPAAVTAGLLPRIPLLTSKYRLLIGAVADPRIAEMAAARGDADAVYEAGAAERALADRARIAAQLRRRGVDIVDAPPDRLPSALADAYLRLKAAGQL